MNTATQSVANEPVPLATTVPGRSPRLWPGIVLLAIFWLAWFIVARLDKPYFVGFIYNMAAPALLLLLFSIWWWTNRGIRLAERVFGCVVVLTLGLAVFPFCDESLWFGLPTDGLPRALTVLTLWTLLIKWTAFSWSRLGLVVLLGLSWGYYTLIRVDGLNSDLQGDISWRWTPTAEKLFLAQKARERTEGAAPQLPDSESVLTLSEGDWPAFRGEDREGVIRGVKIAADWDSNPPKLRWRQRVGPGWSSVIVIGDRLFTQEQRGDVETVVCYQASTGKELWVHEDTCRFNETVSGAGPRATPTFSGGRLFTLGATGILNCLDARTGTRHWSADVTDEASAKPPMWGYSSSPLVVDDLVIVFAGGKGKRNLLAYDAQTGYLKWTAPASHDSYSSPQLVTIEGQRQCLLLGDQGLTAVEPDTGNVLWEHGRAMPGAPRSVQAHRIGKSQLVVGTLDGPGVALIDVERHGKEWRVGQVWSSGRLKPEFPDFVVHKGYAYGFDGPFFCCLDLKSGQRRWKEGRYGRGQVLLLQEAPLLLVISEEGEAIALAPDADEQKELGRFRALKGKTWNHPVIAHGRLYVRNAEEMACYELTGP